MVSLEPKGGRVEAFLARPSDPGFHPGVVIVHEWWGLNDQIKGVAEKLAGAGYVTIVPDLYRGKLGTDAGWAYQLSRALDEDRAVEIIGAAVDWLRSRDSHAGARPAGEQTPVAIWGIGMGGHLSLAVALKRKDLQGTVIFYGDVEPDAEALKSLEVPLLGIFADEDHNIPREKVKAFEATLKDAGKDATILIYRGVGHGFFNEKRPNYEKTAAKIAWDRTLQFLQDKLVAPAKVAPQDARQPLPSPPPHGSREP